MPKHSTYIELFLGSGAVLRNKKPAAKNVGVEIDKDTITSYFPGSDSVIHGCAFKFLSTLNPSPDTLIYADPPYLRSVRSTPKRIYKYELMKESEHIKLLRQLKTLRCFVMISGYDSKLYRDLLPDWRTSSFEMWTRQHKKTQEFVWMNYPEPFQLHDYQYLGRGFRERERIKRIRTRWKRRLLRMDPLERNAILETIEELKNDIASL